MKTGSFLRSALLAGATCLALSAASITHAGILTSSSLSGQGVTINVNGSSTGTTAGAFTGTFDDLLGGGPVGIIFWCIDLFKHVSYPPFSYTGYTAAAFESAPLTFDATRQLNLARLFTNEFANALTSAQNSAAFQIAIWDILYDNDATISTYGGAGQFGISSGNAATLALAQSWVNNLGSGTPQYPLTQLTSREHQDFITPGVPGLLPEPSPLPLLGAGLAVMMFAMRRRKAG